MPCRELRRSRRGFTLLELLVVITILMLALLVFGTFIGPMLAGPSIDRQIAVIGSMTASVRQSAAVRQVHGELVFDYRNDQVVMLSRRSLTTFSFDLSAEGGVGGSVGSGGVIASLSGGAILQSDRSQPLRDGDALELPSPGASFTVPWMGHFDAHGTYEGIAVAFDFYPMESLVARAGFDAGPTAPGPLMRMGGVIMLSVVESSAKGVRLALACGDLVAESGTWLALNRWATIELAVSEYGVNLYVDGRLTEAQLPARFAPPSPSGAELIVGGFPCRIDNLDLMGLISGRTLQLDGTYLIAPGVDPMLEVTGQARHIYDQRQSPITGPGAGEYLPQPGLPQVPPPAIVHVYFDGAGRLDAARHAGAQYVHLVSGTPGGLRRAVLTFHPLGTMTHEFVERFEWEDAP